MKEIVSATIICLFAGLTSVVSAQELSKNVYRIPYADGTRVTITRDFSNHTPVGRIDMTGTGRGKPYRIVAAAAGTIRRIVDEFEERIPTGSGRPCTNNYVWIEHANGEWTKYSHMKRGSTSGDARLREGQYVTAGRFLGYEDEVGCAGGPHLHFEVGVPRATDPFTETGGFLRDNADSARNRVPRICGIDGNQFVASESYTAKKTVGPLARGNREIVREAVASDDLACFLEQGRSSGYRPLWIDGYDRGNENFFNVILRPGRPGFTWAVEYDLNEADMRKRIGDHRQEGRGIVHLESYKNRTAVRFLAIFVNRRTRKSTTFALTRNRHQSEIDSFRKIGKRPGMISVVSIGGIRRYTTLYDPVRRSRNMARSSLPLADYKALSDENAKTGLKLSYLNAYVHRDQLYFSAVWNSDTRGTDKILHIMNTRKYKTEAIISRRSGYLTRFISGYTIGRVTNYAAVWRK